MGIIALNVGGCGTTGFVCTPYLGDFGSSIDDEDNEVVVDVLVSPVEMTSIILSDESVDENDTS